MPKGYKATDDPHLRLDQQAETAHKKAVEELLSRFPLAETDDVGRALVGKVRRAVRSQSAE